MTDSAGAVVKQYFYSPYGEVIHSTGTIQDNYTWIAGSGVWSEDDGYYHMKARYYHAGLKRFLSKDPIGLAGGGNLYWYADGNPLSYIDARGLNKTDSGGRQTTIGQGTWTGSLSDYVGNIDQGYRPEVPVLQDPRAGSRRALEHSNNMVPAHFWGSDIGQGLHEIQLEFIVMSLTEPAIQMGLSKLAKALRAPKTTSGAARRKALRESGTPTGRSVYGSVNGIMNKKEI